MTIASIEANPIINLIIKKFAASSKDLIPTVKALASLIDNSTIWLERVSCIYLSVHFKKNQAEIWVLLDFDNKINTITLTYIIKLGFKIQQTNVGAQKIHDSIFKIFKIVMANF